jgi:rSAM/selenodomain-associated transferase 2
MAVAADNRPRISVIVPALNESGTVQTTLRALQALRERGHEVIVVDGGSTDDTVPCCRPLVDRVIRTSRGRARQMQAGAAQARGDIFWFLHADTVAPQDADLAILHALQHTRHHWGHFDVRFEERDPLLTLIAAAMNRRARVSRIATGDQGLFVTRELFEHSNGFQQVPLMEDIALSRSLKRRGPPVRIARMLTTSARRWKHQGILKTVLLMWSLRLGYFLGASPATLARYYRDTRA